MMYSYACGAGKSKRAPISVITLCACACFECSDYCFTHTHDKFLENRMLKKHQEYTCYACIRAYAYHIYVCLNAPCLEKHIAPNLYACMHVCYACMHACMSCMHACMHACMYLENTQLQTSMYVCMYVRTYVYIYRGTFLPLRSCPPCMA
jgi:hypothetical protein